MVRKALTCFAGRCLEGVQMQSKPTIAFIQIVQNLSNAVRIADLLNLPELVVRFPCMQPMGTARAGGYKMVDDKGRIR